MTMFCVCEYHFRNEDKGHIGYSFEEVDIYAFVPHYAIEKYKEYNHRLTLWKNLKTKEYELVKVSKKPMSMTFEDFYLISAVEDGFIEVIFTSKKLTEVIKKINEYRKKYWCFEGEEFEPWKECTHGKNWEQTSISCRKTKY